MIPPIEGAHSVLFGSSKRQVKPRVPTLAMRAPFASVRALEALNDLSEHLKSALRYPHQPTNCADAQHVLLLRGSGRNT